MANKQKVIWSAMPREELKQKASSEHGKIRARAEREIQNRRVHGHWVD